MAHKEVLGHSPSAFGPAAASAEERILGRGSRVGPRPSWFTNLLCDRYPGLDLPACKMTPLAAFRFQERY